ncbi:uncharacterized protein LOC144197829 [Stigmatopora nigra]
MQLHVCLLLAVFIVVSTTTVQEDSRNSTEEHATPLSHSDRKLHGSFRAGPNYARTQEPYGESGAESGPTTPLIASESSDSEALQFPEEMGNNGAETSVTRVPETAVLTRNVETNAAMLHGTRGYHNFGRFAFSTVTSSPGSGTLLPTPTVIAGTVYHQKHDQTSPTAMETVGKLPSDWSQTDFPQSTPRNTRHPDATELAQRIPGSPQSPKEAIVASDSTQNLLELEDRTGIPGLSPHTSTVTLSEERTKDGMKTAEYIPQEDVLTFRGTEVGTRMLKVSTTLASVKVPDSSGFEDQMATSQYVSEFSDSRTWSPGHLPHSGTIASPVRVQNSTKKWSRTVGHPPHVSTVTPYGVFLTLGSSQDQTGTVEHSPFTSTQDGILTIERKGTPGYPPHMSTMSTPEVVSNSSDTEGQKGTFQYRVIGENGSTIATQKASSDTLSASTSLSFVITSIPKIYVVSDHPATVRVESIELLLQIIVSESRAASGPHLEEDTSTWVGN